MSLAPMRLRLHSVEHYMLADSRRSHPLTFFMRFEIAEQLDASRLRAAIELCCRMHPLLASTIGRRLGRWVWQLSGPPPSLTTHLPSSYLQSRRAWTFDLRRESGLRMSLGNSPSGGSELWLQVHHSCSDARGILQFICDLQAAYDRSLSEATVHQRELAAHQGLPFRAIGFSRHVTSYLYPLSPKWDRIWKYFSHRSRPLRPTLSQANSVSGRQDFSPAFESCRLAFENDSWKQRRGQFHGQATLNDSLLSALFQSLAAHQMRNPPHNRETWLRIGVPIDMRDKQHSVPFACNCSSLVFLDQRIGSMQNQDELLHAVHSEMRHIKHHRLGCVFFDCLALAHSLPLAMWLAVSDQRCAVSAVASNLGAIEFSNRAGFTIQKLDFLPPLRPGTTVAVGMSTYHTELSLALHYDGRLISAADAQLLLEQLSTSMR